MMYLYEGVKGKAASLFVLVIMKSQKPSNSQQKIKEQKELQAESK